VVLLFWLKKKPEVAELPTPTLAPFEPQEPVVREELFPNLILPSSTGSATSNTVHPVSSSLQQGIISPAPPDADQPFIIARSQDSAQVTDVWNRNPSTTPIPLMQYAMPSQRQANQPVPAMATANAAAEMPARMNAASLPLAAPASAPTSPTPGRSLPPLFTPQQLQEARGPLFAPQQLKETRGSLNVWREEAKQQARDLSFVEAHNYLDLLANAGAIRQLLETLQTESSEAVETEERRDAQYADMLAAFGAMEEQFLSVEQALSQSER
jgi:hypothetical protein